MKEILKEWKQYISLNESKQSIVSLGYPEVIASIFYDISSKHAPLLAKWYKEDKTLNLPHRYNAADWFEKEHHSWHGEDLFTMSKLYTLAKKEDKEGYIALCKQEGYGSCEETIELEGFEEIRGAWRDEIQSTLQKDIFFKGEFIGAILKGELTDLAPYKKLSLRAARDLFNERHLKDDSNLIMSFDNGYRWVNGGARCQLIGSKMRNCGSTGVMSMDKDRTMIVLLDDFNEPHVITTYSPNEKRISGIEGKASTAPKDEYLTYIIKLADHLKANLDTHKSPSRLLHILWKLRNTLKSAKRVLEDTYDHIFLITLKDGRQFYTNIYYFIAKEDARSLFKKSWTVKKNLKYVFHYTTREENRNKYIGQYEFFKEND